MIVGYVGVTRAQDTELGTQQALFLYPAGSCLVQGGVLEENQVLESPTLRP